MRVGARVWVLGNNAKGQAATGHEPAFNLHSARATGLDEVIQDVIDDLLVERMNVAVRRQVKLEGFGLDAHLVGDIVDEDFSEVRLAGDGAKRSEIWTIEVDAVITLGFWVGEYFDFRLLR